MPAIELVAKFDWYSFSAAVPFEEVLAAIPAFRRDGASVKRFGKSAHQLVIDTERGTIKVKGGPGEARTLCSASSSAAHEVAAAVRDAGILHSVSRVDVAQDFIGDFSVSREMFVAIANQRQMKARDLMPAPESNYSGSRTIYGGSSVSEYSVKLYEKGLQIGNGAPTDWLRLEHQFRPGKSAVRHAFAELSPVEMVGSRVTARLMSKQLAGIAIAACDFELPPLPKDPIYWMLKQYGRTIRALIDQFGPCEAGKTIGRALLALEEGRYASDASKEPRLCRSLFSNRAASIRFGSSNQMSQRLKMNKEPKKSYNNLSSRQQEERMKNGGCITPARVDCVRVTHARRAMGPNIVFETNATTAEFDARIEKARLTILEHVEELSQLHDVFVKSLREPDVVMRGADHIADQECIALQAVFIVQWAEHLKLAFELQSTLAQQFDVRAYAPEFFEEAAVQIEIWATSAGQNLVEGRWPELKPIMRGIGSR